MQPVEALLQRLTRLAATPLTEATGMPPELYHNAELFELEKKQVFEQEWLCPGRAADVPNPGDYLTFSVADQPILVVRGNDGAVRSFSNICLHRMMRLVEGRGRLSHIVCPYHAWTYGLDGRLVAAGHMDRTPGFVAEREHLPEVRTELWEGWIYVTLDRGAESVAQRLRALRDLVTPYRMADYVPVTTEDYVWDTIWKIVTENFMEGYHLPVAHRETVGAWFPVKDTEFPSDTHEGFTYQIFTKDSTATYGRAHPSNTRLEGRWRYASVMPTIFPTHMYVLAPDHLWYLSLRPQTVGRVSVRFGVALAPEVVSALADPDAFKRELMSFFDKVNAEDRHIVEAIYENTRAPLARPGRLSWLERELHDFAGYLARRLTGPGWESASGQQRATP